MTVNEKNKWSTSLWEQFRAHLMLKFRHQSGSVTLATNRNKYGYMRWEYCAHRSHTLTLPCWRWFHWDGYCVKHTLSCYWNCDGTEESGI